MDGGPYQIRNGVEGCQDERDNRYTNGPSRCYHTENRTPTAEVKTQNPSNWSMGNGEGIHRGSNSGPDIQSVV